jgi:protoporphyrinogen oxidase
MINLKQIILLGSGPISLINAFFLLKDKSLEQLTIIDSASQIGGAWYSDLSPNHHKIECGCHIWSYCPEVHDFIIKQLGVPLYPISPKPVFNKGKINISYPAKSILDSYKFILQNILSLKFENIKNIKKSPKVYYTVVNKKNVYPKHGSPELIDALYSILKRDERVNFFLNEKVDAILINEKVTVTTESNSFVCDKLFVTSTSHLNQITHHEKTIDVKNTKIDYIHFLISLNKGAKKTSPYIRLTSDSIIHRVADISYQTDFKENLLLFGIKEDGYHRQSREEILSHIRSYLESQNIIDKSYTLDFIKEHIFPTYYSTQKTRDSINKLDLSKIELIHSTDIMHGIYFLMERYASI